MSLRSDQFLVSVSVTDPATGEVRNLGDWDKQGGGGLDSEETTYRASGGKRVSLGGGPAPDNVTVSRLYDLVRDHANVGWLLALVGRGQASISKVPTDASYAAQRNPIVWAGTLKRCTPPEVDSDASTPALIELEFTIAEAPKQAA